MIAYRLIRSDRKTLALVVEQDGSVLVRAPKRCSQKQIDSFVSAKEAWVLNAIKTQTERTRANGSLAPAIGKVGYFLGKTFPILQGDKPAFDNIGFYVTSDACARDEMIALYKALAKSDLVRRTALLARAAGVSPKKVTITSAKTRFGSCSGQDSISYPYRLILAPPELVDYVVIHELCHIKQHNHSARFWAEVAALLPDYKQRRQELVEFSRLLQKIGL